MPHALVEIREQITTPLVFVLKTKDRVTGEETAVNLTGAGLLELHVKRKSDDVVTTYKSTDGSPIVAITDAPNGKVTLSPAGTEFLLTQKGYEFYFRVTDVAGKKVDFPSGRHELMNVVEGFVGP